MSERYIKVAAFSQTRWSPDLPIVIRKGAILRDALRGTSVLQLKFQNISKRTVKSIYIRVHAYDRADTLLVLNGQEAVDCSYIDVFCPAGGFFGEKIPVVLTSDFVQRAEIEVQRIVWDNNEVTTVDPSSYLDPGVQQYLPERNQAAFDRICNFSEGVKWLPRLLNGETWQCACGFLTKKNVCPNCHGDKETIFSCVTPELINDTLQETKEKRNRKAEGTKVKVEKSVPNQKRVVLSPNLIAGILFALLAIYNVLPLLDAMAYGVYDYSHNYSYGCGYGYGYSYESSSFCIINLVNIIVFAMISFVLISKRRSIILSIGFILLPVVNFFDFSSAIYYDFGLIVALSIFIADISLLLTGCICAAYTTSWLQKHKEKLKVFWCVPGILLAAATLLGVFCGAVYGIRFFNQLTVICGVLLTLFFVVYPGRIIKIRFNQNPKLNATELNIAAELKSYKELLDGGVITQEDFDAKKKQLLGL